MLFNNERREPVKHRNVVKRGAITGFAPKECPRIGLYEAESGAYADERLRLDGCLDGEGNFPGMSKLTGGSGSMLAEYRNATGESVDVCDAVTTGDGDARSSGSGAGRGSTDGSGVDH